MVVLYWENNIMIWCGQVVATSVTVNYVSMGIHNPRPLAHAMVLKYNCSNWLGDFTALHWLDHVWLMSITSLQWKSAPVFCFLFPAIWLVWTLWSHSPLVHGVTSPARKATTWLETTNSPAWPLDSGAGRHLRALVGHRTDAVRGLQEQHKLAVVQCEVYTALALICAFISHAVVQCTSLKAPPNASMQCQHPLEMYSFGSVCTIQCEEGFNRIGTNMTKCSPHGVWSHALPVCQGMNSDDKVLKYKWAWDTIRILHNEFSLLPQLYVSNQTGWYV